MHNYVHRQSRMTLRSYALCSTIVGPNFRKPQEDLSPKFVFLQW